MVDNLKRMSFNPCTGTNQENLDGNRTLLKLIDKARRHASIASGNFDRLFSDVEISPLPGTISRLVKEVSRDEADLHRISELITAAPEIAAKVLQTVNSAYFALPNPVSNIMRAINLLGLSQIRPLVLSFSMKKSLAPGIDSLFDQNGFWSDALLKALIARAVADHYCREEREEAFTAMLLADIALPVLLTAWGDYYTPVIRQWQSVPDRLSHLEQAGFRWDHAQAGAWILQNWGFPSELVCLVGLHNTGVEKLREVGLETSAALPVTVAALAPSSMRPSSRRARQLVDAATNLMSINRSTFAEILAQVQFEFREISVLFDLLPEPGLALVDLVDQAMAGQDQEVAS